MGAFGRSKFATWALTEKRSTEKPRYLSDFNFLIGCLFFYIEVLISLNFCMQAVKLTESILSCVG